MKNKFRKVLVITFAFLAILVISGCGVQYATTADGDQKVDKETGAKIVDNTIDDSYSIMGSLKEGKWFEGLLVIPIVRSITFFGEKTSYGLALIITTFLVRLVAFPLTIKSTVSAKKQRELQPQIKKIQAKYSGGSREQAILMNSEIKKVYKENNVNMLGGCLGPLITMPLFFAYYSAILRTPGIFSESFLGFDLAVTPSYSLGEGSFYYIIPVILVAAANFFSMKITTELNKPEKSDVKRAYNHNETKTPNMMDSQMKLMTYFLPIMMAFVSYTLPIGISVYFFTSALVSVGQAFVTKKVS